MNLRSANLSDLPKLKAMYKEIIDDFELIQYGFEIKVRS